MRKEIRNESSNTEIVSLVSFSSTVSNTVSLGFKEFLKICALAKFEWKVPILANELGIELNGDFALEANQQFTKVKTLVINLSETIKVGPNKTVEITCIAKKLENFKVSFKARQHLTAVEKGTNNTASAELTKKVLTKRGFRG